MTEDEHDPDLLDDHEGDEDDDLELGADDVEPDADALSDDDSDDFDADDDDDDIVKAVKPPPRKRSTTRGQGIMAGVTRAKLDDPKVAADVWQKLRDKHTELNPKAYSIAEKFAPDDIVEHKKFGVGFVIATPGGTQAEILFADQVRKLVQGR
jgi:hypothetical protein